MMYVYVAQLPKHVSLLGFKILTGMGFKKVGDFLEPLKNYSRDQIRR